MTRTLWNPPIPLYDFLTQEILPNQLPVDMTSSHALEVIRPFLVSTCEYFSAPGDCWFLFDQRLYRFAYYRSDGYRHHGCPGFPYIWEPNTGYHTVVTSNDDFNDWFGAMALTDGACLIIREGDGPVQIKTFEFEDKGPFRKAMEHFSMIRAVTKGIKLTKLWEDVKNG